MRDDAKAVWIAWRLKKHALSMNEMPGIGAVVGDSPDDLTLYHFGGMSRMPFDEESVLVLKDYGVHTNEEFDDAGLWEQFYRDFPPTEGTVEDLTQLSSGWISPNGTIYACRYGMHEELSRRLLRHEGMLGPEDESGMRLTPDQDTLIKARWMRISPVLFDWDNDKAPRLAVTKRQRRRINEISEAIDAAIADGHDLNNMRLSCDCALDDLEE